MGKLTADNDSYRYQLQFANDGTKENPILLYDCNSADAATLGNFLIKLNAMWKPATDGTDVMKIGSLYGFECFIRRQREAHADNGMYEYTYRNAFYAESKSGIKYSWNDGYINIDNPKVAARYFLNAIDRVSALKEKYKKSLADLEQNIPMLQQIIAKPFEKENELSSLKKDVSKLEREISLRIQANKVNNELKVEAKLTVVNEAPVKEMKNGSSPKKEFSKRKGLKM